MKKFIFVNLFLVVGLVSCSKEQEIAPVSTELVITEPLSGEDAAVATFNNFMDMFIEAEVQNGATRSVVNLPKVSRVHSTNSVAYGEPFSATRSTDNGMPIYELILKNDDNTEGFALVAENDGLQDVLAYVPKGYIADTTFNAGLASWFHDMYLMGQEAQQKSVSANEWDNYWKEPDVIEPGWDRKSLWYRNWDYDEYVRDMTPQEIADGINSSWWEPIYYRASAPH